MSNRDSRSLAEGVRGGGSGGGGTGGSAAVPLTRAELVREHSRREQRQRQLQDERGQVTCCLFFLCVFLVASLRLLHLLSYVSATACPLVRILFHVVFFISFSRVLFLFRVVFVSLPVSLGAVVSCCELL